MLYFIGLGLGDQRDITLRGLDAIHSSQKVYLESYTSLLGVDKSSLEDLYGKEVIVADRELVEEHADEILESARDSVVSFLVVGDPFGATTHSDLWLRARRKGIRVEVIHNASIMNAVSVSGLQGYRFGEAVSIVFFTDTWRPTSFYSKIESNRKAGLHTLCLLDIKVKEPSLESLARGKKDCEPARFMSINTAIEQLLEVEKSLGRDVYSENTLAVGIARLGQRDQVIVAGSLRELRDYPFGEPLHSLVIPAEHLHFHEQEVVEEFRLKSN